MQSRARVHVSPLQRGPLIALLLSVVALGTSCRGDGRTAPQPPPAAAVATAEPATTTPAGTAVTGATAAAPTATPLKALRVAPERGTVGSPVSISGEGLPPNEDVEFVWLTVDGGWEMKPTVETVEFYDRTFTPARMALGSARSTAEGRVSLDVAVPADHGETHDIVAVVNGREVAKGGFSVVRSVTMRPESGPVGTLVTIEVNGLGATPFANTMGVLWNTSYAGFISTVTTRGSGIAQLRAAGPPGRHVVRVTDASAAVPYLNTEQSPRKLPQFSFVFTVTEDAGPPQARLDWPEPPATPPAGTFVRTTTGSRPAAQIVNAVVSPPSGPILTRASLTAEGLPAGAAIDLLWVTAKGNRVSPSGWNLEQVKVGEGTSDSAGSLAAQLQVPDDLGGWHSIRLVQGERVLGEAPYFLERSLSSVTPQRVKAGETFQVQVKGIGWTELDNGVAVVYDNSYMGYACGFNSQGDITLTLTAHGQPGTHLIDLYPMIFLGHGKGPWNYNLPQLTSARDHPSLTLGYRLPVFRLAITVIE